MTVDAFLSPTPMHPSLDTLKSTYEPLFEKLSNEELLELFYLISRIYVDRGGNPYDWL